MKNYKFSIWGLALMLIITSCKKEDVQKTNDADQTSNTAKFKEWNFLNSWNSSATENITTYFSKITDSAITNDVARSGLVLVYKKSAEDIQSLPSHEKDTKAYWYYQVSKGSIRINIDNNDGQNLSQQSFSYIIITPQQLSILEENGKSKFDLMQLSYDQASSLLH